MAHIPVMLREVLEYLNPQPNQNFIDCTFGGGGHGLAILEKIKPSGKLLGIDANSASLQLTADRLQLINDNFANLKAIYERHFPYPVSGILFDLGLSSIELEQSGRGFSFMRNEPLDMRFNPESQRLTAAEILNKYSRNKLIEIFKDYGEIPAVKAKTVSMEIIKRRGRKRFQRTEDLVEIIGVKGKNYRIHPATLFFQALRIEVNDELNALREGLAQAVEILAGGGKLAAISFHSLEDRIVKHYFKELGGQDRVKILTKKPVATSQTEVGENPRARSGKLRVIEKI